MLDDGGLFFFLDDFFFEIDQMRDKYKYATW